MREVEMVSRLGLAELAEMKRERERQLASEPVASRRKELQRQIEAIAGEISAREAWIEKRQGRLL